MKFEQKVYETRAERRRDFFIGLAAFFVFNLVMGGLLFGLSALTGNIATGTANTSTSDFINTVLGIADAVLGCFPFVVNIGGLVFFAFTRKWIAMGILAGWGAVLVLTVCAAVIFTVYCFTSLGSGGI